MLRQRPCIICYKSDHNFYKLSQNQAENILNDHIKDSTKAQVTLKRFFDMLERHLDDAKAAGEEGEVIPLPSADHIIKAGMLYCQACSKLVESFCELYHQMKSIELLLNWKLTCLKDVMLCAQRAHGSLRKSLESADQVKFGNLTEEEIFDFKDALIKRCGQKLKTSVPKLKLQKYHPKEPINLSIASGTPSEIYMASPLTIPTDDYDSDNDDALVDGNEIAEPVPSTTTFSTPQSSPRTCKFCRRIFRSQNEKLEHERAVHKGVRFVCGFCPSTFTLRSSTIRHRKYFCKSKRRSFKLEKGESASTEIAHGVSSGPTTDIVHVIASTQHQLKAAGAGNSTTAKTCPRTSEGHPVHAKGHSVTEGRKITVLEKAEGKTARKNLLKKWPPILIIPSSSVNKYGNLQVDVNPGTGRQRCCACPKEFVNAQKCKEHYENMHLLVRHKCPICQGEFRTRSIYTEHLFSSHSDLGYKCANCGQKFNRKSALWKHRQRDHSGELLETQIMS